MRKTVAFGFVGTVLDYAGRGSQRWSKWRPTLCLCQQESLVIDRLELLQDRKSTRLNSSHRARSRMPSSA